MRRGPSEAAFERCRSWPAFAHLEDWRQMCNLCHPYEVTECSIPFLSSLPSLLKPTRVPVAPVRVGVPAAPRTYICLFKALGAVMSQLIKGRIPVSNKTTSGQKATFVRGRNPLRTSCCDSVKGNINHFAVTFTCRNIFQCCLHYLE